MDFKIKHFLNLNLNLSFKNIFVKILIIRSSKMGIKLVGFSDRQEVFEL